MHWPCIWYGYADVKSITDVAFGSLTLQWRTDVVFGSLTLQRRTDMLMQIDAGVTVQQKKTFILTNILLEKFTVFTLLGSSAPNTHFKAQLLVEILKKKENYKPHCQAEAMCKFDFCRPKNVVHVDLNIAHHLDYVTLIIYRCHWYLSCWYPQCQLVGVLQWN